MENRHHALKRTRGDVIYDTVIFIILTFIFFIVAYPLYFVIISSISDPIEVSAGKVVLTPVGVTLDGYTEVFKTKTVMRGFRNSLIITVMGTCINLLVTIPTSYALSRPDFSLKRPITLFYIVTMFVGGGMMPTYIIIRDTGLLDTWWALVLPGCLGVYNMIVARTFFKTNIPLELMEAAKLDGCGNTKFFIYIVLPLSGAITAILCLYYGVGHWNSYFSALMASAAGAEEHPGAEHQHPDQAGHDRGGTAGKAASGSSEGNDEVFPDHHLLHPRADHLPLRAEALRQGRHDRLRKGLITQTV